MGHRDDSAAGSTVENIKQWWDELVKVGSLMIITQTAQRLTFSLSQIKYSL